MWETGETLGGGGDGVVNGLSGKLLTGGQSMFECGGESSSFFMISNLTSFEDKGSVCSGAVESCASSLISIGIVGLGSQSGDSYSMMQWRCRNGKQAKKL